MTDFSRLQQVKRRFFAMRNGVIADTYRRAGSPFRIIFGLNIPQICEIADEFSPDSELAAELWANSTTRESMLLAPMLLSPESLSREQALKMIQESPSAETTDILCHKLLRHTPFSFELALENADAQCTVLCRYAALRLLWHHLGHHKEIIKQIAEEEISRQHPLTQLPASQIIQEIEFLDEAK